MNSYEDSESGLKQHDLICYEPGQWVKVKSGNDRVIEYGLIIDPREEGWCDEMPGQRGLWTLEDDGLWIPVKIFRHEGTKFNYDAERSGGYGPDDFEMCPDGPPFDCPNCESGFVPDGDYLCESCRFG